MNPHEMNIPNFGIASTKIKHAPYYSKLEKTVWQCSIGR
jgi:hypothetical protein